MKFGDLVFGDEVIDLPPSNDPPHIGSWSPENVAEAAVPLRAIDLKELRRKDEELGRAVGEVRKWAQKAAERPGWGVIGFSI